jgi:hypothetical protein
MQLARGREADEVGRVEADGAELAYLDAEIEEGARGEAAGPERKGSAQASRVGKVR